MSKTIKLIDHPHDLERSTILRCPARWPDEDYVGLPAPPYKIKGT